MHTTRSLGSPLHPASQAERPRRRAASMSMMFEKFSEKAAGAFVSGRVSPRHPRYPEDGGTFEGVERLVESRCEGTS